MIRVSIVFFTGISHSILFLNIYISRVVLQKEIFQAEMNIKNWIPDHRCVTMWVCYKGMHDQVLGVCI